MLPSTNKDIIDILISEYDFSIIEIANHLGVTERTIYRIRKNQHISAKTTADLFTLYYACLYNVIKK